jgi:hypothetical protein
MFKEISTKWTKGRSKATFLFVRARCLLAKEWHKLDRVSPVYNSRTGELGAGGDQKLQVSFSCPVTLRLAWSTWWVLGQSGLLSSKQHNTTHSWEVARKPPGSIYPDIWCLLKDPIHRVACTAHSQAYEPGRPCFCRWENGDSEPRCSNCERWALLAEPSFPYFSLLAGFLDWAFRWKHSLVALVFCFLLNIVFAVFESSPGPSLGKETKEVLVTAAWTVSATVQVLFQLSRPSGPGQGRCPQKHIWLLFTVYLGSNQTKETNKAQTYAY